MTSPIQWRPRELPGGAAEKTSKSIKIHQKIQNTKEAGGSEGGSPLTGDIHPSLSKLQKINFHWSYEGHHYLVRDDI